MATLSHWNLYQNRLQSQHSQYSAERMDCKNNVYSLDLFLVIWSYTKWKLSTEKNILYTVSELAVFRARVGLLVMSLASDLGLDLRLGRWDLRLDTSDLQTSLIIGQAFCTQTLYHVCVTQNYKTVAHVYRVSFSTYSEISVGKSQ